MIESNLNNQNPCKISAILREAALGGRDERRSVIEWRRQVFAWSREGSTMLRMAKLPAVLTAVVYLSFVQGLLSHSINTNHTLANISRRFGH